MSNKYYAIGDINPLEGCIYIKHDSEDSYSYIAIEPINDNNTCIVYYGSVDLDDSWINWDSVKDTCDTDMTNPYCKAYDVISYYGHYNLGSSEYELTEQEVYEVLKNHNIEIDN